MGKGGRVTWMLITCSSSDTQFSRGSYTILTIHCYYLHIIRCPWQQHLYGDGSSSGNTSKRICRDTILNNIIVCDVGLSPGEDKTS